LRLDGPNPFDRAAFSGFAFPVVVIGKNDAVISPGAGKGLLVTAGSRVEARTLTISGGPGSLGVQADTGAELHMDRCLIQNNSIGGILINGASYDIQNTIIVKNGGTSGYGIQINAGSASSRFWFNTVASNPVAATCNLGSADELKASIVIGPVINCPIPNTVTSTSTLGSTFHLTTSVTCPDAAPGGAPDHDFDGDPRTAPVDCGADQFQVP
jgi:hypothetical protein